jgi:hypothetical protein
MNEKEIILKLKTLKGTDAKLKTAQERIRDRRRNIGKQIKRLEEKLLKTDTDRIGKRTEEFMQELSEERQTDDEIFWDTDRIIEMMDEEEEEEVNDGMKKRRNNNDGIKENKRIKTY